LGTETDNDILNNINLSTLTTSTQIRWWPFAHLLVGSFRAHSPSLWDYTLTLTLRHLQKTIKELGNQARELLRWKLDKIKLIKRLSLEQLLMDWLWFRFTIILIKVCMMTSVGRVVTMLNRIITTGMTMKLPIRISHLLYLINWDHQSLQLLISLHPRNRTCYIPNSIHTVMYLYQRSLRAFLIDTTSLVCNGLW